jgi:hypothetical protein
MRFQNRAQTLLLTVWAVLSVLAGSMLTSFHQALALPSRSISSLATEKHGWRAMHLLAADCGCSQKVSEYLSKRAPLEGVSEEVVFIGAADPFRNRESLLARGFNAKSIRADDLEPFAMKGAPLLIFISPRDEIVYMGGYGMGGYRDVFIWSQLSAGALVRPLPAFGCAVGQGLKRGIDPFSWKDSNTAHENRR